MSKRAAFLAAPLAFLPLPGQDAMPPNPGRAAAVAEVSDAPCYSHVDRVQAPPTGEGFLSVKIPAADGIDLLTVNIWHERTRRIAQVGITHVVYDAPPVPVDLGEPHVVDDVAGPEEQVNASGQLLDVDITASAVMIGFVCAQQT